MTYPPKGQIDVTRRWLADAVAAIRGHAAGGAGGQHRRHARHVPGARDRRRRPSIAPGTYIYSDRYMAAHGVGTLADCALRVRRHRGVAADRRPRHHRRRLEELLLRPDGARGYGAILEHPRPRWRSSARSTAMSTCRAAATSRGSATGSPSSPTMPAPSATCMTASMASAATGWSGSSRSRRAAGYSRRHVPCYPADRKGIFRRRTHRALGLSLGVAALGPSSRHRPGLRGRRRRNMSRFLYIYARPITRFRCCSGSRSRPHDLHADVAGKCGCSRSMIENRPAASASSCRASRKSSPSSPTAIRCAASSDLAEADPYEWDGLIPTCGSAALSRCDRGRPGAHHLCPGAGGGGLGPADLVYLRHPVASASRSSW